MDVDKMPIFLFVFIAVIAGGGNFGAACAAGVVAYWYYDGR